MYTTPLIEREGKSNTDSKEKITSGKWLSFPKIPKRWQRRFSKIPDNKMLEALKKAKALKSCHTTKNTIRTARDSTSEREKLLLMALINCKLALAMQISCFLA